MLLSRGPRQNGHRPALDPLFRSAAAANGARVVGVVLTGYLDDGTAGLGAIKARNGITVVQDPDDAAVGDMPRSALQNVKVDYCAPLEDIGPLLIRLANKRTKSKKGSPVMEKINFHPTEMEKKFGAPTSFVCPECNGPLWETESGKSLQFRCHVGHSYSPDSLLAEQDYSLERVLWSAVRIMEERAALLRRLSKQSQHRFVGRRGSFGSRAEQLEKDARTLRKLVNGN
jgi:two-component system chemotaxis response regulator CheB